MVPWLNKWRIGLGFMGEQGAESIHAAVNAITRAYTSIPDKVSQVYIQVHHRQGSPILVHNMPSSTTLHYIFHCIKHSSSHSYTFTLTTALQEQSRTL